MAARKELGANRHTAIEALRGGMGYSTLVERIIHKARLEQQSGEKIVRVENYELKTLLYLFKPTVRKAKKQIK